MFNKLHPSDKYLNSWKNDISPRIRSLYWRARANYAELILKICFTNRTRNRSEHIRGLEEKVKNQKEEITNMREILEYRNKERKALNILVACDGPCNRAYMENPSDVDQKTVDIIKRNYERFIHWWDRGGQKAADEYLLRHKNTKGN